MTTTTDDTAQAVVRRFWACAGPDTYQDRARLVHDDLVIHEPAGLPFGGEFRGISGYEDITSQVAELFEVEIVDPIRYVGSGNPVVVRTASRFTSRATGRTTETAIVMLLDVRDGRIAEMDVFYREPEAIAELVAP